MEPPVNGIRLTLDRDGLAPRIGNPDEWREHLVAHLAPPAHRAWSFPCGCGPRTASCLLSTTIVLGTPREVTLSELAIEAFYPADAAPGRCCWRARGPGAGGRQG